MEMFDSGRPHVCCSEKLIRNAVVFAAHTLSDFEENIESRGKESPGTHNDFSLSWRGKRAHILNMSLASRFYKDEKD